MMPVFASVISRAASEGLDDLVVRIGRMIAYQEYNTRSPLNGLAAKWAAEHQDLLPIDDQIVAPPIEGDGASIATEPAVPQTGATVNHDLVPDPPANGRNGSSFPRVGCNEKPREPQVPPLRSPGFPVETRGFDALHAALSTESRKRGRR